MLRKDPTNPKARRTRYLEEHPLNRTNQNFLPLPEHLFVNLINMELQKKIAKAKNMDYDTAEAIEELIEQGPREAKKNLMDWEVEEFEGENVLFYKRKNYVPIEL
jgi:hypothetical protein